MLDSFRGGTLSIAAYDQQIHLGDYESGVVISTGRGYRMYKIPMSIKWKALGLWGRVRYLDKIGHPLYVALCDCVSMRVLLDD